MILQVKGKSEERYMAKHVCNEVPRRFFSIHYIYTYIVILWYYPRISGDSVFINVLQRNVQCDCFRDEF